MEVKKSLLSVQFDSSKSQFSSRIDHLTIVLTLALE